MQSLRLYRSVGLHVPRAVFMLLEHSGSGLLWLPLAPLLWLAPSASPQARRRRICECLCMQQALLEWQRTPSACENGFSL